MSDSISSLIVIPPTIAKEIYISGMMQSLASSEGTVGVSGPIHGYISTEIVANSMLAASSDDLKHYVLYGELGTLTCEVSLYAIYPSATLLRITLQDWGVFGDALRDSSKDPAFVDLLAHDCIALCEAVQASFAAFTFDNTSLLGEEVDILIHDSMNKYITHFVNVWLTYFNDETFPIWFGQYSGTEAVRKLVRLASGARVCFGPGYSPWNDNEDLEKHYGWLEHNLQKHTDINGVSDILDMLQFLMTQIPPRPADNSPFEQRESYSDRRQQAHNQIDGLRLLWATALQRPGLVSINHFPNGDASITSNDLLQLGATLVPIVADHGHEWCLYTDQGDFDITAPDWAGPLGLWTRLLSLQRVAQEHQIDGMSPRVVLVTWRDLAFPLRDQIKAQGITIIPSSQTAPLLPLDG